MPTLTTSKILRSVASLPLDFFKNNIVLGISYYKLLSSYDGYCIRVRRSSDNLTQDFGFVNNYIDYAGIVAFCGSGNGFVHTWYNQYVGGNNAIQTSNNNQPQIVSNGLFKWNGAIFTSSNSNYMTITDYASINITTPILSIYANYTPTTSHQGYIISKSEDSLHQYSMLNNLATVTLYLNISITNTNHNATSNNKILMKWLGTDVNQFVKNVNGTEETTTINTTLTNKSNFIIGARHPYNVYFNGSISGIIIANTDLNYNILSKY